MGLQAEKRKENRRSQRSLSSFNRNVRVHALRSSYTIPIQTWNIPTYIMCKSNSHLETPHTMLKAWLCHFDTDKNINVVCSIHTNVANDYPMHPTDDIMFSVAPIGWWSVSVKFLPTSHHVDISLNGWKDQRLIHSDNRDITIDVKNGLEMLHNSELKPAIKVIIWKVRGGLKQ